MRRGRGGRCGGGGGGGDGSHFGVVLLTIVDDLVGCLFGVVSALLEGVSNKNRRCMEISLLMSRFRFGFGFGMGMMGRYE